MANEVAKPSAAVEEMSRHWPLIDSLLGGTSAMRDAGERYLPRWPAEEADSYRFRLSTATLHPAFSRTVDVLSAKPFSKALQLSDDVPARIRAWTDDIDLEGRNLHVFAADLCEEALSHGICGVLVEYPRADGVRTRADEIAAGARPYWVHIHPQQLLGWRAERQSGAWVMQQLRFVEVVSEPDGQFGEAAIEQIRVIEPEQWSVYRSVTGSSNDWYLYDQGVNTLGQVPFVPIYGQRTGYMTARPPLLEMAHLACKHWQSQSDQDTIMHVARVPILANASGDERTQIAVGGAVAVTLPLDAKLYYVEHSGSAIGAGRESLKDLEDQMRQAGAELLVLRPGQVTATEVVSDNEQGMCALQRIAQDLEDAIDQALQLTAEWVGEASGGNCSIYKDFGAASLAEASAQLLLTANTAGKLSDETLFDELKRRGIVSADRTWDDEQERIQQQGPALGMIGNANGE